MIYKYEDRAEREIMDTCIIFIVFCTRSGRGRVQYAIVV